MNIRQKKKVFKRRYGYNPPKNELDYHMKNYNKIFDVFVPVSEKTISDALCSFKKFLVQCIETLRKSR